MLFKLKSFPEIQTPLSQTIKRNFKIGCVEEKETRRWQDLTIRQEKFSIDWVAVKISTNAYLHKNVQSVKKKEQPYKF